MRCPKTLLLVALLATPTATVRAQQVAVGVKAGLNASTYHGQDVLNARFRLGPAAGLMARLPLSTHWSVQPELLYEGRGARTSIAATAPYGYYSYAFTYRQQTKSRAHYLTLPVLVRGQLHKFFALAGPQGSYLLRMQQVTTTRIEGASTVARPVGPSSVTERGTGAYHRWELGYVAGVGYQVTPKLGVEVRYAAAVTKLRQQQNLNPYYDTVFMPNPQLSARNGSVQAQVSYWFAAL